MNWGDIVFWGLLAAFTYFLFGALSEVIQHLSQINAKLTEMSANIEVIRGSTSCTGLLFTSNQIENERGLRKAREEEMMRQQREYG